jgi:hypothetical protein
MSGLSHVRVCVLGGQLAGHIGVCVRPLDVL